MKQCWVFLFGLLIIPTSYGQDVPMRYLDHLSSPFRECNLSVTPDGKYLFFMSSRGGQPWSTEKYAIYEGQWQFDGDIWYSRRKNGSWTKPVNPGPPINTSWAEDEPNVTPDGQQVLYQSWKDGWWRDGGPYYLSELYGNEWGKPHGLSGGITRFFYLNAREYEQYATDGAALSPDGNTFMVCAGPDYDGDMDIYISRKINDGKWSVPEKTSISTPFNERSLFIAGDNRTVYFASNGYHQGDDLEMYRTSLTEDGQFGKVISLGAPFNTPADDFGFIVTASGKEAYFVRNDVVVQADLTHAPQSIKPLPTVVVSGKILNLQGEPVPAEVSIIQLEKDRVAASGKSNSLTGEYSLSFYKEPGKYKQVFQSEEFQTFSKPVELEADSTYDEIQVSVAMTPKNVTLLFFEHNSSQLLPKATGKLDSLTRKLYQNKKLRVLVTGHANAVGEATYNLVLSKSRAQAVKDYLTDQGIPEFVIKTESMGDRDPLVGREISNWETLNRRVEVALLLPQDQ